MKKFSIILYIFIIFLTFNVINGDNNLITYEFNNYSKDFKETLIFSIGKNIIHVVEKGDTLYSLSKRYNVSIESIIKLNNIVDNNIKIGQKLIISGSGLNFYSLFLRFEVKLKTNHILKIYPKAYNNYVKCFSPVSQGVIKNIQYINGYGQTIFISSNNYMILIGGFDSIGVKGGQNVNINSYLGTIGKESNLSISIFKDKKIIDLSSLIKN